MISKKITQFLDPEKFNSVSSSIVVALVYAVFLVFIVDWTHSYEFDPDEGYNVIKVLMLEHGFKLYDEISNDQPPAFTLILWLAFKVFGWHINVGRLVVMAFASLMVFGIYDSVRRFNGVPAALSAIAFLIVSHNFTQVSVSIMLGQPSLAMAVMSGWGLAVWYEQRRTVFLLLSGIFLGVSFSLKMFTLFIGPIGLFCILLYGKNLPYRNFQRLIFNQFSIWLMGVIVAGLFFLSPVLSSNDPAQLVTAHTNPLVEYEHILGKALWKIIINNWVLILMSVMGGLYAFINRNLVGVFFGLWLLIASVILFFHHPVWYHHAFLFIIPASVMAGLTACWITEALVKCRWSQSNATLLGLIVLVLIAVISLKVTDRRPGETTHPWHYSDKDADQLATKIINYYAGPERTMITSRQMYAFNTQSLVPPNLAVTSNKRYRAKLWSATTMIEDIEKQNIEQVVLSDRWKILVRKEIKQAIQEKYTRVYSNPLNHQLEIFVRKDIAAKKRPLENEGMIKTGGLNIL